MDLRLVNQGESNEKTSARPRFNQVSSKDYLKQLPDGTYVPLGTTPGPPGQAATVNVGSTSTVNFPAQCAVTNVGTQNAAILDFVLARGPAATVNVGTTTTLPPGSACTATNVGTTSSAVINFGIAQGLAGTPGAAASVMVGSTTTLPPGTPCSVSNSGTSEAAILNFGIAQGTAGTPGTNGTAATVAIGTVNTVAPPGPPTVVNSGTASAAVLDFGLVQGADGANATIAIGTVTQLAPGSVPTVVNVGSATNAILDWGIVTGDTGATGASGANGAAASIAVGSVVALAPGSTPTVVNAGTSSAAVLDFGLVSGADGQDATITVGTVTALAPGSTPTVVDSGTPGSAVFDFGLVTGDTGATGAAGPPGPDGLAASIAIGTVSAVAYGSAPNVVNVGTPTAAVLDWTLVTGPQGPPGSSSSVLEYQFKTATTAPPGNGNIQLNNTPSTTNEVYVSHLDVNGVDQDYILQLVQTGSNLIIQKKNDSTILYTYEVTLVVINTGYVQYDVNFISAAGTLANNDQVILLLVAVGQPGTAATVNVGTVTQVPYSPTAITVTNSGTTSAALLDFVLCAGPDGAPGANGAAATVAVGTTTTLAPGAPATVVNSGTSSAAVLDFGIPAGLTGATGSAATLTIGSTTTLPAGSSATASNSGTSSAAILNLGIPIGDPGSAATITVGSVSSLAPGSTPTVTNVGTSSAAVFNFGLTEGAQGNPGTGATVAVGTVTTLSAGQPATVTNVGTPSAVVLNYGIPQGQTGPQGSVGPAGPPGPSGSSSPYTTKSTFSYYGTTASTQHVNMPSGTINTLGSIAAGVVTATTSIRTRQMRASNAPSSTADGQDAGWFGTISSNTTTFGQCFLYSYSFGIEDTVAGSTRTMVGLLQGTTAPTLSSTATVQASTTPFCGIMHEVGETVWSFYTRGPSGFVKTATTISCVAPSSLWYQITIENAPGSLDCTITLTALTYNAASSAQSYSFTAGGTDTPSTSAFNYVLLIRAMASAGGLNNTARLSLASVNIHTL